jgi:hypothetical protein
MTTFSQLVDEVSLSLSGYTLRQDRQTHLTAPITSNDTTIPVANASNISSGIIEIDDELMYVESFDRTAKTLTVPPYGRGYSGTTSSNHGVGKRVAISPTFPKISIKRAINDTINSVYPDLYGISTTTFQYKPAQASYALPSGAETVLAVSYETIGPSKQWLPIRAWRMDGMANVSSFNSTNSITLLGPVEPGRTVQVTYTMQPDLLNADYDDFEMTTGLPPSAKDVIVLGAAYRLASFVDPGRLTFASAESDSQSNVVGRSYGTGTNTAKYLLALYQQRLADESRKLSDRFPVRVHYTN